MAHVESRIDHLARGEDKYREGDLEGAIRECNKALHAGEARLPAYLLRGRAYFHLRYFEPCVRDCRLALQFAPDSAAARMMLEKASVANAKRRAALQARREFHGFRISKCLGVGWEGAVYVARDPGGKKHVLKAFHEHRIGRINSEEVMFHRKPVRGCAGDLARLSRAMATNPCPTLYPFDLIRDAGGVVGLAYPYQYLIPIRRRYLSYPGLPETVMRAYFLTQSWLLRHFSFVAVDATIDQLMFTRRGTLRFIDYGESIHPIDDYRCREEHREIQALIKLVYGLLKPKSLSRFHGANLDIVTDPEHGWLDLLGRYSPLADITEAIAGKQYARFLEPAWYQNLYAEASEVLGARARLRINVHDLAAHGKRHAVGAGWGDTPLPQRLGRLLRRSDNAATDAAEGGIPGVNEPSESSPLTPRA